MTTPVDLPATSELDLSEIQSAVSRGETTITVPAGTHNADLPAIASCIKEAKGITQDLSATKITAIGERAFASCSALKTVILPSTLTSIGERAFSWCESLTSITIGSGVTSIGEWVFYRCKRLTSITFERTEGWCL